VGPYLQTWVTPLQGAVGTYVVLVAVGVDDAFDSMLGETVEKLTPGVGAAGVDHPSVNEIGRRPIAADSPQGAGEVKSGDVAMV
jgi:hypothetical protein